MTPCCGGGGGPLPITTGRVGLSQTSGQISFYNPPHVWTANTNCWWSPCPYPGWPVPTRFCPPPGSGWGGGCCGSCGCSPCCCQDNTRCFVSLLTNIGPWCCYWQDQQYSAWLTGKQPWPSTAEAANSTLQSSLPAACFPPLPSPPYPAPAAMAA